MSLVYQRVLRVICGPDKKSHDFFKKSQNFVALLWLYWWWVLQPDAAQRSRASSSTRPRRPSTCPLTAHYPRAPQPQCSPAGTLSKPNQLQPTSHRQHHMSGRWEPDRHRPLLHHFHRVLHPEQPPHWALRRHVCVVLVMKHPCFLSLPLLASDHHAYYRGLVELVLYLGLFGDLVSFSLSLSALNFLQVMEWVKTGQILHSLNVIYTIGHAVHRFVVSIDDCFNFHCVFHHQESP